MNYALPEKLSPLTQNHRPLERLLLARIEALKDRLDTLSVVDAQRKVVGEVRNLVLYRQRLHLVIVQPDAHRNWRFILLSSHLVQRINLRDRTILIHTTYIDSSYLPQQRSLKQLNIARDANYASVIAPVSQLPALSTYDISKTLPVVESPAMPKVLADVVKLLGEGMPSSPQEMIEVHHSHFDSMVMPMQRVTVGISERIPYK